MSKNQFALSILSQPLVKTSKAKSWDAGNESWDAFWRILATQASSFSDDHPLHYGFREHQSHLASRSHQGGHKGIHQSCGELKPQTRRMGRDNGTGRYLNFARSSSGSGGCLRSFAHRQVESSGCDLAEPAVSV